MCFGFAIFKFGDDCTKISSYFTVLANRHLTKLLRGHIRASRKLGLCRLWSFGIHLSLHIETGRVDGVTATHISKQ